MSDGLAIFLGIALLLLNALFVGAEFSLLSSRRDRLEALLAQGIGRARIVIKASQEGSLMLTSAQLGITLCSLGLGRLGEPAVAHQLQRLVAPLPRKLTGMQTQSVGNMAICLVSPMPTKRFRQTVCRV